LPVPGVPNAFQFFGYSSDYHFTVDQFTIERNGAVIFDDPFGDGFAPPSAPAFANGVPASYQAIGGYTESGGRLHLDGEFAAALRGVANPNLVASQAALLLTNIDPADLTRGLKSDDDFTVEARFDLAVPGDGQAYGISLTDNSFGGLPADRIGDSNVNLLVRPGAGGGLIVQLNDFDNIADSATTLESLPFSPESGESQIVLRLVHDVDQPGLVHAEFDLLDDEGVTRTFELTQPGHIFGSATPGYAGDDENWTRAQLVAFGPDTESTTFQGTYGSLTVEQNGAWNYTLDNGLPAVQALAQSQFAQDVISVRVADEHGLSSFRPVFISVQGSNDPVVTTGGVTSGAVAEDTILTAFGSVSFTDVDLADVHGAFFTPAPTNTTALGFFSLGFVDEAPDSAHGSVGWSYNLDNAAAQFLAQGETVFETYTVTVQDFWGSFTTQDVTIAIMGRDEVVGNIPPDITGGTTTGQVYEDGAAGVARGQLTALDPELGTLTWTIDPMPATAFGSANVGQDGQWTYFLNNGLVQQLGQGGSAQDQFTVRVTDPHGASDTQTVTVNVTGTGDRPNFTTPAPVLMVSEDGGFVSGQTSAFEIDSGTVLHWSLNRGSTSGYFSDYEFRADSFSIQKNGAPLFHDGFDAGGPPPSAPDFIPAPPPGGSPATSYSTTGIFQEIGGNLVMRGSNAFAFRGTGNDALVVGNEAILSTNVDPANLQAGLKQNHQFVVEGVFDLIEPGQPRQGYGLTLTDAVNRIADDLLSLTVTRDPGDNQVYVRFANSSSVLDTAVLVDRDLLVAGGADQIRLMLSHAADSGNVTASYELLDDGVIVGGGDLGEAGIFGADTPGFSGDDENWIRAGLFSNGLDAGEFVQTLAGAYGTLTVDNSEVNNIGQLIYTPGAAAQALGQGDSVVDTFFVRVIDPQGMSNSQRVDITVTGFNDPPDPEADSNSVVEDVVTRAVGNVLTNDFDVDHGSVLTVATPGTFFGTYGTLTLNANGAYEYQLDHALADFLAEGQVVHDVFEGVYGITDGALTNFATLLEIEITGTGEAPVPLAGEVFEDGSRSASGELVPAGTWSVDNPGTLTNPAYRFLIDNFSVTRNGLPYFDDGFGNNVPPPSAPGLQNELPPNTPSYALNGSFQESGGRVILDGSRSVEVEGTGSPGSRFATSARLLTDNTADFTRGLKIDDSFTVEGRFDLVLDLDPRDHYGVRLTDSGGGVTGSDLVQAVVRRDAGGNLEVALVELDGPTDSSITLEAIALVPEEGENQILLRLSHDPADQGVVHASFDLIGDPTPRSFSFTEVGHIFGTGTPGDASDDEVFTRAEFRASADGAMENGVYGTLSVDADGNWNYELNNAAASVQALAQDERASDLFLVRNGAGDTQVLRIDVVGSDDAPVGVNIGFASFFQGPAFTGTYVIEDSAQQVTRGHAFATDVDHGAALQWSVSPVTIVPTGPSSFQVFGYSSDYHFTVDQLTVERNGVVIFDDPFSDGLAPPSAPPFANGTPANYLTNLARFSEAGDRLVLDGSAANAVRGIGNPDLAAGHIAVLGSNIDPADPTRGLKSDDDFTVEARFDLVTPSVAQGYGLSLTDNTTGGLPPDQLGDDGINLFVRADAVGSLRVEFTRFDIPADTVTLYQSLPFAPGPGENQIVLRLTHDVDNPGQVHAAFDLLDGVGGVNTTQFDQLGQIFGTGTPGYAGDDENWTRAQIVAFGPDSYAGVTTLQGIYGSLSVDPNGDFTYTLDNGAANVQALAQGQVAVDSFNVRATDQYGLSNRVVLNVNVIGTGEEAPPAPAPDVLGDGQNNVLVGSSLGERFYGGNGADLLIGLDGSDTFDYNALSEGGDTIADFTPGAGGDILDLSDLVPPGTPNPADSVQLQEFQTANGPSTTVLFDHVPFATLQGVGGLVLSDFVADNLFL
jgi:VCBS repeat-containing protein